MMISRGERLRIGYLIGQFPAPTHTFIWRDVIAIERQGVEVDLLSTRAPEGELAPHAWVNDALARTTYLGGDVTRIGLAALAACLATPMRMIQCLLAWIQLEGLSTTQRIKALAFIAVSSQLLQYCKSRGIVHVHVPFPAQAAYLAVFSKILGGPDFSIGTHGNARMFGRALNLKSKWERAAFGTAITPELRTALRHELGTAAPTTILIAPMGVDPENFRRRDAYEPWREGTVRLFSCGRGVVDKGHLEAVSAVGILVSLGFDAQLRIAGEFEHNGWFTNKLQSHIEELELEKRVHLLGSIPEHLVAGELERCHIFLLATRDEGLGVAIMEAMSMEVPVVSTSVGGVPTLVDTGVQGVLVPPESPRHLADALLQILQAPLEARAMGIRGRKKIVVGFTPEVGAARFCAEVHRRYAKPRVRS